MSNDIGRRGRIGACILGAVFGFGSGMASAAYQPGSNFEIDIPNANFVQDSPSPSIDWVSVKDDTVIATDKPTGSNDDSFKGGTKEDSLDPQTTTGSIPNNKSDLLNFGVHQEKNANGNFLQLFWTRVQDPSGTTLMDFELNAATSLYPPTATGAQFAIREAGDLLVEYKLAQGGTNPQLFLYEWLESAVDGTCEASNTYPCWGNQKDLTAASMAIGSINTTVQSSGTLGIGSFDPYTFGEATIDLSAIFDPEKCESFGLASLKSRSSDSFTAQMKDFIAPVPVNISNCGSLKVIKTDDQEPPAALAGAEFQLYNDLGIVGTYEPGTDTDTGKTCTTLSDGTCVFADLLAGNYCVVETKAPAGHSIPADPDYWACTTVKADDNSASVTFVDPRIPAKINIVKKDDADNLLAGAQFTLYTDVNSNQQYDDGTDTILTTATNNPCTTNASGECSISDILPPGDYCVVETVTPANYNTAAPQCIALKLADEITLTFVDPRQRGAILITKTRKHKAAGAGDQPHAGVEFTVSGNGITPVKVTTDANGKACVDNLLLSSFFAGAAYTVTETLPTGYAAEGDLAKTVVVDNAAKCNDTTYVGETVAFKNIPLSNITVSFAPQVVGGTAAKISCTSITPDPDDLTPAAYDDVSETYKNLKPGVYTCTVDIDP